MSIAYLLGGSLLAVVMLLFCEGTKEGLADVESTREREPLAYRVESGKQSWLVLVLGRQDG